MHQKGNSLPFVLFAFFVAKFYFLIREKIFLFSSSTFLP